MKRSCTLLFLLLSPFMAMYSQELTYEFDFITSKSILNFTDNKEPRKSLTAVHSKDNSYYMFLMTNNHNNELHLFFLDYKGGWYARAESTWDQISKEDAVIELKKNRRERYKINSKSEFYITDRGVYDTLIRNNNYLALDLIYKYKKNLYVHNYIVDSQYNEDPSLTAERIANNVSLLEEFPRGRVLAYQITDSKGQKLVRGDLLYQTPISLKVVFK